MHSAYSQPPGLAVQHVIDDHLCTIDTLKPGDIITIGNVIYIYLTQKKNLYATLRALIKVVPTKRAPLLALSRKFETLRKNVHSDKARIEILKQYTALTFARVPNQTAAPPCTPTTSTAALTPTTFTDAPTPVPTTSTAAPSSTPSTSTAAATPATPTSGPCSDPLPFPQPRLTATSPLSPVKTRKYCSNCSRKNNEMLKMRAEKNEAKRMYRQQYADKVRSLGTSKKLNAKIKPRDAQLTKLKDSVKPAKTLWDNERRRLNYALQKKDEQIDKLQKELAEKSGYVRYLENELMK